MIFPSPAEVLQRRQLLESARQHLGQQRPLESAKAYAALLAREPECVEALGQLGCLLFQFGQYAESLTSLQKAAHLAPALPKLNLLLGAVLRKLGRLEESADCCLRETAISPVDPDAHYNLGLARQSLSRPREALDSYRQAVKLRPGYVDALMGMGMALRQTDDDLAALEILSGSSPWNPPMPRRTGNRPPFCFHRGNLNGAGRSTSGAGS